MATKYEAPVEVRELEKAINDFTRHYGLEIKQVFADFLRYIINGWTLPGYPGYSDWKYTQEQNAAFHNMHKIWLQIMEKEIGDGGWFDPFGDLFIALTSQYSIQQKAQFFTPVAVCDLMSRISYGDNEKPRLKNFSDPAAGSGRLLLATNYHYPGNFMVAQDVDYTCCLMTVCNFLIHGCVGLVICKNTLTLRDFRGAWLVNEFYYRTEIPTIRPLTEKELTYMENSESWRALLVSPENFECVERATKIWDIINSFSALENTPDDQTKTEASLNEEKQNALKT